MEDKENIKELLIEVTKDINKIIELEKYNPQEVVDIALDEKLYDSLLVIFKPITINGVTKIYFDPFSIDYLNKLDNSYDTKEEAEQEAREEYDIRQADEEYMSLFGNQTYEEILSSKIIIPKEIKDKLRKSLFSIDMDLIKKIKIKDSHARQISGIGHPINSIEDVIFYAEPACIEACIELFNKNIFTTMNDTECVIEERSKENGVCFISCEYESLSQENKDIFDELIKTGVSRRTMDGAFDSVLISVPCNGEETVGEVSQKLLNIVSKFKIQDILYGNYTLEDFWNSMLVKLSKTHPAIYSKYFDKDDYTWSDLIAFAEEIGFYYDPQEDLIWNDKNLYERHKKYLSSVPPQSNTPMMM